MLSRIFQFFSKSKSPETKGVILGRSLRGVAFEHIQMNPDDSTHTLMFGSKRSGLSQDILDGSFLDIKGHPELRQRLYAVTSGTPTIYDERGYPGGMPSPQAARLLLEDFATGLAIPHGNIQPGWKERLESVAAGKHVDPSFWQP